MSVHLSPCFDSVHAIVCSLYVCVYLPISIYLSIYLVRDILASPVMLFEVGSRVRFA